jgi:hypothetical protein
MVSKKSVPFFGLLLAVLFVWAGCDAGLVGSGGESGSPVMKYYVPAGFVAKVDTDSHVFWAGQTLNAGAVTVSVIGQNLEVELDTSATGAVMQDVHLWVGQDISTVPVNNSNVPVPGQFQYAGGYDYGAVVNGVNASVYKFVIPLSALGPDVTIDGQQFYVLAHAALVGGQTSDGQSLDGETAWAGLDIWASNRWAYYFNFTVTVEEEEKPVTEWVELGTGFAVGDRTFTQLFGKKARWGWVITVNPGSYSTPIYVGAGGNDVSKGVHVGDLVYSYSGGVLNVSYNLKPGYGLTETHVYAGSSNPITTAPGQYGNQKTLDYAGSDSYSIALSGSPVYLIAHATVFEAK